MIRVANRGGLTARGLELRIGLPARLRPPAAPVGLVLTESGMHRSLSTLAPGAVRTFRVRLVADTLASGIQPVSARLTARGLAPVSATVRSRLTPGACPPLPA